LTDDELAQVAQDGLQGQGAPVEAMRRLRDVIDQSSKQNDTYSRRMLWLTIVLTVLTIVQVIAAIPSIKTAIQIIKAWMIR
jgi:hypothetical protein